MRVAFMLGWKRQKYSTVPAFFKTRVTVFFGGIVTSQSPLRAVAVWAKMSLLIHSMVSPTFAEASAGEITRFSIVIWMLAACAELDIASSSAATVDSVHLGIMRRSLTSRCLRFARHVARGPGRS